MYVTSNRTYVRLVIRRHVSGATLIMGFRWRSGDFATSGARRDTFREGNFPLGKGAKSTTTRKG